jgi:hypothetical protein
MKPLKNSGHENTYSIRIKGTGDSHWRDWLGEIQIIPQKNNETVLICQFTDQPALRGFLDQLWNKNITVLSVQKGVQTHP